MSEDFRIVPCEACGSEGRIYIANGDDRETGAPQERDGGPCPYCEGIGGEIISVETITIDDLSDEMAMAVPTPTSPALAEAMELHDAISNCPFCGSEGGILEDGGYNGKGFVRCWTCWSAGPEADSKQEAVTAWNTRAATAKAAT